MDTLAHGLWTNVVFVKQTHRDRSWAIFFGIAPDAFSFGVFILSQFWSGNFLLHNEKIPLYVNTLYDYTHSLVIFLAIFGLVALFNHGQVWWPLAGWGFHIIIDIFTHTYDFFPTPFLFPISSWKLSFFSWADQTFMIVNYAFLVLVYVSLYRRYSNR